MQPLSSRRVFNKLLSTTVGVAMAFSTFAGLPLAVRAQEVAPSALQQINAPDAYEVNDSCATAASLGANSAGQLRNLVSQSVADQDWARIDVVQGERYQLQASAISAGADIGVQLYDDCGLASLSETLPDGVMEFTANANASYFVQVKNNQATGAATDYRLQLTHLPDRVSGIIKLSDVPIDLHRRAADFLESMRGGDLAPEWTNARLADEVRTILRPDVEGPAYYEFPVEKPSSVGGFEPSGFIQVAAGTHDYPITHWDVSGQSPTQALDEQASLEDTTTSEYYKLDALSYMAEHEELSPIGITIVATDVVQLGVMPPKLIGLEELPLAEAQEVTSAEWRPDTTVANDDAIDPNNPISGTLVVDNEQPQSLSQETWDSWAEVKTEYKQTYGVFLDGLKNDASDEWQATENTMQYGEGLVKGDERTVRGLASQTLNQITVSGAGANALYLQQEELKEGSALAGIKLTVIGEPEASATAGAPLSVTLAYAGGTSEVVKFVISPATAQKVFLPLVTGDTNSGAAAEFQSTTAVQGSWGPWSYWWAGSHGDQRLYDQIQANTFNNPFPCWSGCGATAWAMAFGWADHQAALNNPAWSHRKGIYRQDGGYGFDADAPQFMDAGIRNISMEIRGYIGTYCNAGGGWTQASTMGNASRYMSGRSGASTRSLYANGWWIFGTSEEQVRDRAISSIKNGRPVVIGRDSHFPLAYGYAEQTKRDCFLFICSTEYNRWFYVNQGWGGSSNGWVTAKAWFAGEVLPN